MASDLIESVLQAHRSGDLDKLEECWLDLVESLPTESQPLVGILDELVEWGETGRALPMLEMLVPPLRDAKRWPELLEVLQRIVNLNPDVDELGPDFAACYQHVHADCDTIDLFIEKSRLRFARPIGPALKAMDVFLAFRHGDVVLHESGWGLGMVKGFDPLSAMLIVDFDEKKDHRFNAAAAPKLLKKLEADDFRTLKITDPDRLAAMAQDNPVELVRRVLAARLRKATAARIKSALVPDVIPAKSWSGWWTKARRAAEKDPLIQSKGTGATTSFSLLEVPADPVLEALAGFRNTLSRRERAQLALNASKSVHATQVVPVLVEAIRAVPTESIGEKAEYHFLLHALGETQTDRFDPETLVCHDTALAVLTGIEHSHLRSLAYQAVRTSAMDNRVEFLKRAFTQVHHDLWDDIHADLEALGESGRQVLTETITEICRHPRSNPDPFGWIVSRSLRAKLVNPALPDPHALLRKLVDAINQLYLHHATDKDYRQRLHRMSAILFERDGTTLDAILDRGTAEEAHGLRERFHSCLAFTDGMKRELSIRIARRHPPQRSDHTTDEIPDEDTPAISSDVIWTSEPAFIARQARYKKLVNDDIPDGQKALNQAASYGDLSENAEWSYALDQQTQMTQQAEQMESEFARVRIIEKDRVPVDRMGLGSRGRFENVETGETAFFTILGPWDVDSDNGVLSYESPLALQLLNRLVNTTFTVTLPHGTQQLRLVAVENALDAPSTDVG